MSYLSAQWGLRARELDMAGKHSILTCTGEGYGSEVLHYLARTWWEDTKKVSLRKPRHLRTDDMKYVCDFPAGRDIVLVYPIHGDIIRWVAGKDAYGFDTHESHTFDFHMSFPCQCATCMGE